MALDDWAGSATPGVLLSDPWKRATRRKRRLFACACCRASWALLRPASRPAVEVAERFADGAADADELGLANYRAEAAVPGYITDPERGDYINELVRNAGWADDPAPSAAEVRAARERRSRDREAAEMAEWVSSESLDDRPPTWFSGACRGELVAEVFGNPFRPVAVAPAWRTDAAVTLARRMYDARDFSPMPVLADALEDAGCDDADALAHCRGPGPYVRGCWAVDLVLAKS